MNHSFDIEVAAEVGVEAAIILSNIEHWVKRNTANGDNVRDGKAWVYNSRAAWCEIFPYLGEKQIRNALERLLASGFVVRENYSFGSVNRTYWYGLGERAKPFGPKGPNIGSGQKGQTITVEKPIIESTPSESPQPTKASRRGSTPAIRLDQFLQSSGGEPPIEFWDYSAGLGWSREFERGVWTKFSRYWRSPDAKGGGRKRDWLSTWQNWCDREAENGARGRANGGSADRGLAGAMRSSLAQRHGAAQPGGGISRGTTANGAEPLGPGETVVIPAGEIPF
jgi:hypothetical protein